MIAPDFLDDMLRCPLDPRTRLAEDGDRLVCTRCTVRFAVTNDFPNLIPEEAELPAGCASLDQLPCQRERVATTPPAGR